MHYYKFHVGDYVKDTQHLDEMEDLAYRRLLDLYYLRDGDIPGTVQEIARLIRMRSHIESITNVLREFFELEDGRYKNSRADAELGKFFEKSEKAKKSVLARWNKNKDLQNTNVCETYSEGNANVCETYNEGNTNHKPITNNHKPITKEQETTRIATAPASAALKTEQLDLVVPDEPETKSKAPTKLDFSPLGFTDEQIAEFKTLRKSAKAPITQRVINMAAKHFQTIRDAGYSSEDILNLWASKGWRTVEAEWFFNETENRNKPSQSWRQSNVYDSTTMSAAELNAMINDPDL